MGMRPQIAGVMVKPHLTSLMILREQSLIRISGLTILLAPIFRIQYQMVSFQFLEPVVMPGKGHIGSAGLWIYPPRLLCTQKRQALANYISTSFLLDMPMVMGIGQGGIYIALQLYAMVPTWYLAEACPGLALLHGLALPAIPFMISEVKYMPMDGASSL